MNSETVCPQVEVEVCEESCPVCLETEALTEAQKTEIVRLKQSGEDRITMLRNVANKVATIFKLDVNLRFIPKGPQNVEMPYIVIPMAPPEERVPKETPACAKCGCRGRFKGQQVNCTHKRCGCGRPVCNYCFHCSNCQRHFEYVDVLRDRYDLPFEIIPPSCTN